MANEQYSIAHQRNIVDGGTYSTILYYFKNL